MEFAIRPRIHDYDTFAAFEQAHAVGSRDLILTQRFLHETFFSQTQAQTLFYDDYCDGEPTDKAVDAMLTEVRSRDFDRLIAIGGGSILDCAKVLALDSDDTVASLFAPDVQPGRKVELFLSPTTCGTGCEVTCVSVFDFPEVGSKIGKGFNAGFADHAVLIDEFLSNIPYPVFARSSADALVHALEIYLAPGASVYTDMFCLAATRSILQGYVRIAGLGPGVIQEDAKAYLAASNMAGIALANVLAGGVHAIAMHFGSEHHVPHGEATRLFLPPVFKTYYSKAPTGKIADIAQLIEEILGPCGSGQTPFEALDVLLSKVVPTRRLSEYGMNMGDADRYADKVIETQQRLLVNNYTPLSKADIVQIYSQLM
ncbi:4-hydroxybutyrate dehydrogenase [Halomonas cupida]|uniref:4-hydroxybutyrate dehydrogenase n=1 Tax=Halomonas cupida TaxID=44933 RepID=A0A1M7MRX3_9GAMM|nr:iron-containing alcohol dehydrogenase [Halomonas cupida]GEN26009.1 4-hydroxybutyrate dehydrogenase [Halomonas cupida]SHM93844.1 4-hydroxybutyrate dehydrogenase [Halomonas cupida]